MPAPIRRASGLPAGNFSVKLSAEAVVQGGAFRTQGVGDRFALFPKLVGVHDDKLHRSHPQAFAPAANDEKLIRVRAATSQRSRIKRNHGRYCEPIPEFRLSGFLRHPSSGPNPHFVPSHHRSHGAHDKRHGAFFATPLIPGAWRFRFPARHLALCAESRITSLQSPHLFSFSSHFPRPHLNAPRLPCFQRPICMGTYIPSTIRRIPPPTKASRKSPP